MRRIITFIIIMIFCLSMVACEKSNAVFEDEMTSFFNETDIKDVLHEDSNLYVADDTGIVGAFTVKEKKKNYKGKDIEILYIKNNTGNEYEITVNGSFLDENEKEACNGMEKTRTLFINSEICFVFQPGATFDHFEYKLSSEKKEALSNGALTIPSYITFEIAPNPVDVYEGRDKVHATLVFELRIQNSFSKEKWISGNLVIFDNTGEVFDILKYNKVTGTNIDIKMMEIKLESILWEEGMKIPENLEGQLEIAFDYEYSDT